MKLQHGVVALAIAAFLMLSLGLGYGIGAAGFDFKASGTREHLTFAISINAYLGSSINEPP